jgi:outer membrane protein OmpA-like peptidoglycan-associated protein
MRPFGHVALAAATAALASCASPVVSEYPRLDAAAMMAAMPVYEAPVLVSDFDAMRAALPGFDLQRTFDRTAQYDVSVIRDLTFTADSSILSRADVARLLPLHAYLRENPSVAVLIKGYGDGANSAAAGTDLSINRAQAVARALLTDMRVATTLQSTGAAMPQHKQNAGRAEIVFTTPMINHVE